MHINILEMFFLPAIWTIHCLNLVSSCSKTLGLLKTILASKFLNYTFYFFSPFRSVGQLPVEYFTFLQNSLVWLWAAAQRHDGQTSARLFVCYWHVAGRPLSRLMFVRFRLEASFSLWRSVSYPINFLIFEKKICNFLPPVSHGLTNKT